MHNNFVETLQDEQAISPQIGLVQSSVIGEQNTSIDVLCKEKTLDDYRKEGMSENLIFAIRKIRHDKFWMNIRNKLRL